MKKLLNTLYITSPYSYLSLDGENVVITKEDKSVIQMPLHNLESIVGFGFTGASPSLMGKCMDMNISLTFMTMHGRFLARVVGADKGNILLRKEQFRISESLDKKLIYAQNMIVAKLINSRNIILRFKRDYALRTNCEKLSVVAEDLKQAAIKIKKAESAAEIRGIEGSAAKAYFNIFDDMILKQ